MNRAMLAAAAWCLMFLSTKVRDSRDRLYSLAMAMALHCGVGRKTNPSGKHCMMRVRDKTHSEAMGEVERRG